MEEEKNIIFTPMVNRRGRANAGLEKQELILAKPQCFRFSRYVTMMIVDTIMPMILNDCDVQESWVHGKTGACGFASPNTDMGF